MNNTKMIDACEKYGVDPNAARMRFNNLYPNDKFERRAEYPPEIIDAVFAKEIGKAGAKKSDPNAQNTGEAKRENIGENRREAKAKEAEEKARAANKERKRKNVALFFVLSFCVVGIAAHCAMVTYEAREVWNLPGLLAGFVISFCVLFVVALSAIRSRAEVSVWAVWCIAPINAICARVHYLYFNRTSPENGWDNVLIACSVPAIAWFLEYLFREIANYQDEQ